MKKRIGINIRLNPEEEADRRAWDYLQQLDRKMYKSYSRAIVAAINEFFGRQERLIADSYLETREKEDAFLQSVLETVTKGLRQFPREAMIPTADSPLEDTAKQGEAVKAALEFLDSF